MTGDPYEEADNQQRDEEAKLVASPPAKKNRKVVIAAMVLVGAILALVMLANIAGLVTNRSVEAQKATRPVTMTGSQSAGFADQQSGQAAFLKGMDRDKKANAAGDTIMGYGKGLASDTLAEADGVPPRTKAQEAAMNGTGGGGVPSAPSMAEQQRDRELAEAEHRRQNDLDSSPLALDFSDYFAKDKPVLIATSTVGGTPAAAGLPETTATATPAPPLVPVKHARSAIEEALLAEAEPIAAASRTAGQKREPHAPEQDFVFDSSFGKLYRLMEDTIIETVLVNRLAGTASGPVITMVTTDIYSASGQHLLIPKGTRLLGSVTAVANLNQERLFVAFHRMIMPDGYSVSLDKFKGLDVVGQTGLRDLVNHHYVQIFGASLALAAVAATALFGNNSGLGVYDWGTQMRNGASQGLGQSAQRVMERFMNVLPTFTVRERARVKIMLAGDMLLPDTKNHSMDPDL